MKVKITGKVKGLQTGKIYELPEEEAEQYIAEGLAFEIKKEEKPLFDVKKKVKK